MLEIDTLILNNLFRAGWETKIHMEIRGHFLRELGLEKISQCFQVIKKFPERLNEYLSRHFKKFPERSCGHRSQFFPKVSERYRHNWITNWKKQELFAIFQIAVTEFFVDWSDV